MPSFNPIMVDSYAALFCCTAVVQVSYNILCRVRYKAFRSWLRTDDCLLFSLALANRVDIYSPESSIVLSKCLS